MKTVGTLKAAFKLIEAPESWCQGVSARDAEGRAMLSSNPKATRFCLIGAICKAGEGSEPRIKAIGVIAKIFGIPFEEVVCFNDTHTHAEVLNLLQRAIKFAEEETLS